MSLRIQYISKKDYPEAEKIPILKNFSLWKKRFVEDTLVIQRIWFQKVKKTPQNNPKPQTTQPTLQ